MANGNGNPITAPLSMLKQVGEQSVAAINSIGTNMANTASRTLDSFISGTPKLPGLPGMGNGGGGASAKTLLPANLQQALGNIENVLIPPGLPKPSQAMTTQPAQTQTQPAQPAQAAVTQGAEQVPAAMATRRRVAERRGY
jgi:hypothetical protein